MGIRHGNPGRHQPWNAVLYIWKSWPLWNTDYSMFCRRHWEKWTGTTTSSKDSFFSCDSNKQSERGSGGQVGHILCCRRTILPIKIQDVYEIKNIWIINLLPFPQLCLFQIKSRKILLCQVIDGFAVQLWHMFSQVHQWECTSSSGKDS